MYAYIYDTYCFVSIQMADKPYEIFNQKLPTLTPQTSGWTPYSNYTQPTPWFTHCTNYTPEQTSNMALDTQAPPHKTPTKQISTCNTQFQHLTTLQDATLISPPQRFLPTNNILPQNTNTQPLQNSNTPSLQIQTVPLQNTVTQPLQTQSHGDSTKHIQHYITTYIYHNVTPNNPASYT